MTRLILTMCGAFLLTGCSRSSQPVSINEPVSNAGIEADPQKNVPVETAPTPAQAIRAIAGEIEALRGDFAQLADFSAAANCDAERLVISYDHHTHPSEHRGGWTSGVPNPDPDGVWFHIDFHDPESTAQIHTQPMVPELRYGDLRVLFLILEGTETTRLSAAIRRILENNGVAAPDPER